MAIVESIEADIPKPEERRPLDSKIMGGLAINGLSTEALQQIGRRVEASFLELREDESRAFGACIAYCLGLSADELCQVREFIRECTGNPGGEEPLDETVTATEIWVSRMGGRLVGVREARAAIAFDDGSIQEEATIFSLHATALPTYSNPTV